MFLPPRIASVRALGTAPVARGKRWSLIGQDGGQSIDLGDRTLFVFSDSLFSLVPGRPREALTAETGYFLGNCAALSAGQTFPAALASLTYYTDAHGMPREIIAATPFERFAGHRFWPQHGIAIGPHVYLYYLGLHQFDQTSTWGFRPTGSGIARVDPCTGECDRIMAGTNWCLWRVGDDDLRLGTQVLRAGDLLYVFGTRRTRAGRHAILARVPEGAITDIAAYEYLSATTPAWIPRVEDACAIAACANEVSVSFNAYLEAYLMVYVDDGTKQLFVRTAKELWGPYSDAVSAGRVPLRDKVDVVALAFEHPLFSTNNGRTVVITYCQPNFTQNASIALTFA